MNSFLGSVMDLPAHITQPVHIGTLAPADSPRLRGVEEKHAQRLAEVYESLPPILVHRPTMRVIDGMHRIRAAELLGLDRIQAQFFDGAEEEAFIQAVTRNIAHGLPLSIADRRAAAARILNSFPAMSDRSVAVYTGLDSETVAAVRASTESPQVNVRTGRDGKPHPLDRTAERIHAAELIARRPDLPLRAVAQESGLSLGTAHDVRRRVFRGEAPTPPQGSPRSTAPSGQAAAPAAARRRSPGRATPARGALENLRVLANDPSLRHSEAGRDFVRWLHAHFINDEAWRRRTDAIPPHCLDAVVDISLRCSESWRRLAQELTDRRASEAPQTRPTSAARS